MRKFALATAAAVALLFTAPSFTGVTTPAEAQTTVVKKKVVVKHGDRGRHMGRYGDAAVTWAGTLTAAVTRLAPLQSRRQEGRDHQEEGQRQDRDQEEGHARLSPRDFVKQAAPGDRGRFAISPRVSLVLEFPAGSLGPGDIAMSKRLVLSACAVMLLSASALAKPGVATTTVNLRAEANTTSEVLAKIPAGSAPRRRRLQRRLVRRHLPGQERLCDPDRARCERAPARGAPRAAARRLRSRRRFRTGRAGLSAVSGRAARGLRAGAVLRAGTLFLWPGAVLGRRIRLSRLAEVVGGDNGQPKKRFSLCQRSRLGSGQSAFSFGGLRTCREDDGTLRHC